MIKQKDHSVLIYTLPIIVLALLGCGLSGVLGGAGSGREPTPTRTPLPTFTPVAQDDAFIQVDVAETQPEVIEPAAQPESDTTGSEVVEPQPVVQVVEPTPTPIPEEPTATPVPVEESVTITLLQNMNVRGGPGVNYPVIGPGPTGESTKVIGRNSDSTWLKIEYPSADGTGWIYGPLVQINGNPETVAIASAPPPPPTPIPVPTEPPAPPPPPEPQYQFTPTGWHASGNPGIIHFKGRIKDEAGNLVNGYSVLIDNWAWSIMSHPSGASHHYPEKGDGEWDVVFPTENLGDGVGWWWLSVVRYECADFLSRFDAQCKQFTRLSEEVKIMVNWPDETVINADWICHWDCNQGIYVDGFRRSN